MRLGGAGGGGRRWSRARQGEAGRGRGRERGRERGRKMPGWGRRAGVGGGGWRKYIPMLVWDSRTRTEESKRYATRYCIQALTQDKKRSFHVLRQPLRSPYERPTSPTPLIYLLRLALSLSLPLSLPPPPSSLSLCCLSVCLSSSLDPRPSRNRSLQPGLAPSIRLKKGCTRLLHPQLPANPSRPCAVEGHQIKGRQPARTQQPAPSRAEPVHVSAPTASTQLKRHWCTAQEGGGLGEPRKLPRSFRRRPHPHPHPGLGPGLDATASTGSLTIPFADVPCLALCMYFMCLVCNATQRNATHCTVTWSPYHILGRSQSQSHPHSLTRLRSRVPFPGPVSLLVP